MDFDDWLLDHVREMLAFPGFQAARIFRGTDLTEANKVLRVVSYELRTRRELDSYLHTHAARMRADGLKRFGKQMSASRRIVPADSYAVPEGLDVLFGNADISGGHPICANCHQPVEGRFCAACGQEDRTYLLSVRDLAMDFFGELFNFDSRFFRSMLPLLFRPGLLTLEYIRGRRQLYFPPVKLYVFISLVFFFTATLLTDIDIGKGDVLFNGDFEQTDAREWNSLNENEQQDVLDDLARLSEEHNVILPLREGIALLGPESRGEQAVRPDNGGNIQVSIPGASEEFTERVERGARVFKNDPELLLKTLTEQIPATMFVFLPLIALLLKLLYPLSGRYYVEHLIYTLHLHSAVFVILLSWLLFGELAEWVSPLQRISGWVTAAVWIYMPVYLYRSLRRVYGQGHFVTSLKFFLLTVAYTIALGMTAAFVAVATLYRAA